MEKPFSFLLIMIVAGALNALPSFPGAEGWGADTPGGRGGKVYVVTNTNSFGPGSLLEALMAQEPRTIVFRISGVINVQQGAKWELNGSRSNVTIAGQTSPGGVTLVSSRGGAGSSIFWCYDECNPSKGGQNFHDGIFRFLRFRGSEWNTDGLTLTYSNNFIFDHCDFSGGSDETQDLTHDHHFTVQWCTMTNSATSGGQAYGSLISYYPNSHITMHHNLYANHKNRGPHVGWPHTDGPPDNGLIAYINNVNYNFQIYSFDIISDGLTQPLHMNVEGNYFKAGPSTPTDGNFWNQVKLYPARVYIDDNCHEDQTGTKRIDVTEELGRLGESMPARWDMPTVTTHSHAEACSLVLEKAGALPHDPMNIRTANDVRNGTGVFGKIDDAKIETGPPPPDDSDLDGMPDFWETAMGLNPNDYNDHSGDHDGDGYTNIEEYINDLALLLLGEAPHNSATEQAVSSNYSKRPISIHPSPYNGSGPVSLKIILKPGIDIAGKVRVIDARGRTVRNLKPGARMTWDGLGANGRPLAQGVYLIRWTCDNQLMGSRPLVIIK